MIEKLYVPTLDGGSLEFDGVNTVKVTEFTYGPRMGLRTTWTTTIPLSMISSITTRRATFWIMGWVIIATPGKTFTLRMGIRNRDVMLELVDAINIARAAL